MRHYDCRDPDDRERGLGMATSTLRRGRLVVAPTDSVYAVVGDAFSAPAAVALQRVRGRGPSSNLPVMVPAPRTVDGLAIGVTATARELMAAFWPGPLTLIFEQQPSLAWQIGGSDLVAVRMPLHPVLLHLLGAIGPLAVLPAARLGQTAPLTAGEAVVHLGDDAEIYLDAGPMQESAASSIVDLSGEYPLLRREGAISLAQLQAVEPTVRRPEPTT